MSRDQLPSTNQTTEEATPLVADKFDGFGHKGYAFCPCTNRFEEWIFQRLWIIPLLPLCVAIVTSIMASQLTESRIVVGRHIWFIDTLAEETISATITIIVPLLGIAIIEALLLMRFARNAPKTFLALAKAGRFRPGDDSPDSKVSVSPTAASGVKKKMATRWSTLKHDLRVKPRNWDTFANDFEQAIRSPWRNVFSAVLTIVFLSLTLAAGKQGQAVIFDRPDAFPLIFYPFIVWDVTILLIMPVLGGYFFGISLWLLFVVGTYIGWLTPAFKLDIQPRHGDKCGGLRRVGNLCLEMAAMASLPAIVFGGWGLAGILAISIDAIAGTVFVLTTIMVATGFLTFFLPLWDVHSEMVREKFKYQDESTLRIALVEKDLRDEVNRKKPDAEKIELLENKLEKLQQLYPPDLKYPTWPFDTNILLKFVTPQIVPIIALILRLTSDDAALLRDIITFISGLFV